MGDVRTCSGCAKFEYSSNESNGAGRRASKVESSYSFDSGDDDA